MTNVLFKCRLSALHHILETTIQVRPIVQIVIMMSVVLLHYVFGVSSCTYPSFSDNLIQQIFIVRSAVILFT